MKKKKKPSKIFKSFIVLVASTLCLAYVRDGEIMVASKDILGEEANLIMMIAIPIIITIIYYLNSNKRTEEEEEEVTPKDETKLLSEKYKVLKFFKSLVFILIPLYIASYIYSLSELLELRDFAEEQANRLIIYISLSSAITIFSLFCITKIIDFLFDLEK